MGEKPARREALQQPARQLIGVGAFGRADRAGRPFFRIAVGGGDECGFAAHRQPHIHGFQPRFHGLSRSVDRRPIAFCVGLGDAGGFAQPLHLHLKAELDLARLQDPVDRGGGLRGRRRGERDMPLAREQARCGVHPDPARAGDEGFRPGVQIGEIGLRPRGAAIDRLFIRRQLDEVARHETRRDPHMAQQVDQQPSRIPARSAA